MSSSKTRQVQCIDASNRYGLNVSLTKGKIYTVAEHTQLSFFVVDDSGTSRSYDKDRFRELVEVPKKKKVRCIDPPPSLTKNKIYEVNDENDNYYYVTNDNNNQTAGYLKDRFIDVEKVRPFPGKAGSLLTPGKEYDLLSESAEGYCVIDDTGGERWFEKDRLEKIFPSTAQVASKIFLNEEDRAKKETAMSNTSPLDLIANSVIHGIKVAGAAHSADLTLELAKKFFGSDNPILATDDGRQLAKFMVSSVGIYVMSNGVLPFKLPFDPALVQGFFSKVLEASSRDFVQPKLAMLTEKSSELLELLGQMASSAMSSGFNLTEKISVPESPAPTATVSEEAKAEVSVEAAVAVK
jgi:hypothetical protein